VNAYRVAAHSFFAWLVRDGRWESNPVEQVARVRPGESTRRRRALTAEELQRLVAASPPHRAACYLVAATSGLRRGELAALAWGDVDLDAATVRVRPTMAKNRREALLPLPEGTVAALRGLGGDRRLPTTPVFADGVPRTSTLRKDLARAGIVPETDAWIVDLHSLRVTFAALLGRAGVPLVHAQRLMRHSDPKLTANIYTRLELRDGHEAVARIDLGVAPARTARA
jgi:integrase